MTMIHPEADLHTEFKENSLQETQEDAQVEVEVERNAFGYLIHVVMTIVWLSLFLSLTGSLIFSNKWDILGIVESINPVPLTLLILASFLLAIFHAYVLHFDSYERKKKDTDDLKMRIINAWPLVLGTLLYTAVVCIEIWRTKIFNTASREYFHFYDFSIHNILRLFLLLNIPLNICVIFLTEGSYWNVFSAWTVKSSNDKQPEKSENISVPDAECRVVGFFVSIVLALIWFVVALIIFAYMMAANVEIRSFIDQTISSLVIYIYALYIFGVHVYSLCTPKYDSGEGITWKGFIKKNWLILSSCTVVVITVIFLTLIRWWTKGIFEGFEIIYFFVILSLCSCSIMIPSNKSQSCIRYLKPWNLETQTHTEENYV